MDFDLFFLLSFDILQLYNATRVVIHGYFERYIMNLLLNFFTNFWDNLITRLSMPEIIVALVVAAVGLGLAIIAKKVAKTVRKTDEIDDKDPVMIGFKVTGLALLFVALLIIVFRAGV